MGKLVDLKDFMTKMGIPYQGAKNDDNAVLIKPEIKLSNRKELCARIVCHDQKDMVLCFLIFYNLDLESYDLYYLANKMNCKSSLFEKVAVDNNEKIVCIVPLFDARTSREIYSSVLAKALEYAEMLENFYEMVEIE